MDAKPISNQSAKPGVILEGSIGFANGAFVSSYANYWAQIVRLNDTKTGAQRVVFRVLRDKTGAMQGQAGHLPEDKIKRQVVIWSSLGNADTQLPRKVQITSEPTKVKFMGKATFDFSVQVDASAKYNLRASCERERQQWVSMLTQQCQGDQQKKQFNANEDDLEIQESPMESARSGTTSQQPSLKGSVIYEDRLVHFKEYGLDKPVVSDCEMVRVCIPGEGNVRLNATALMKILKQAAGKDLSKFALPVWVNEPTSILQRSSEFMIFNNFLTQASMEESSTKRMLYVAARMVCSQYVIPGRTGKPFNPLLGETFELVTPEFRFFSEMVSHHPPIFASSCEGQGYEYRRCSETVQQFTGKLVKAYDKNMASIDLFLAPGPLDEESLVETYRFMEPNVVCGNIFVGTRYVEPAGSSIIRCDQTGDVAEVHFKERGWTKSEKDENYVKVAIKNGMGEVCYTIAGKYTEKLVATNTITNEEWVLFIAPEKPADHQRMYNMNLMSLQLNVLSDELKQAVPPTDCRLRTDIQKWD